MIHEITGGPNKQSNSPFHPKTLPPFFSLICRVRALQDGGNDTTDLDSLAQLPITGDSVQLLHRRAFKELQTRPQESTQKQRG